MIPKHTFYFLIDNIQSDFSCYGNDVTWHGRIVDENNVVVNDEVSINTLEIGVDFFTQINESDEEYRIINEDGDIIDQKAYDDEVEATKEMYLDYYWEMDVDVSEYSQVDDKSYIRISISDFIERHTIGTVGRTRKWNFECDYNTPVGLIALSNVCHDDFEVGEWSDEFIYLEEFEWNENYSDYIEGWLRTTDGYESYISLFGVGTDEESKKKLREIEESGTSEDYERLYDVLKDVIYTACDDHISVAEFRRRYQLEYVDTTKIIGVRSGFNAAYLPVNL